MKQLNILLLLLGLGVLIYLTLQVGLEDLAKQVKELGWGVILLIASEGLGNLAHTVGWRHCITRTGVRVPLFRLFRMAMAGFAINYLLPTASVGGEATKAALLSSN